MKTIKQITVMAAFIGLLHCGTASAQPQGQPNFANMDPQQMMQMIQQRMMDNLREQMGITNDADWGVIQDRLTKVTRMQMDNMMSMGMGMMGGGRRAGAGGPGGGGFPGFAGFGQPDPNVENLQNCIDNNVPVAQIRSALAKLRESRQQKQAELDKAREDLRSVVTMRQEAVLVLAGILE